MSLATLSISIIWLVLCLALIIGFMYEEEVIEFEQNLKKKICKYIYDKIISYEQWRDMKKAGNMAKSLFADTYKYQERYELFGSIFGEEHPMVISSGGKWFACSQLIQQNGLEEPYRKYCESQVKKGQKNNRVSGN